MPPAWVIVVICWGFEEDCVDLEGYGSILVQFGIDVFGGSSRRLAASDSRLPAVRLTLCLRREVPLDHVITQLHVAGYPTMLLPLQQMQIHPRYSVCLLVRHLL